MLTGPFVFVDVDTQRDFLDPDGALYVPDSTAIVGNLARLTACTRDRRIPVLATACAHTLDEPDPEPFPPHCIIGTRGQERVAATARADTVVVTPNARLSGELPVHLTLHKRRYDFFSHPDADRIVALLCRSDPLFVVYGVATDYCVRAAVLGLLKRGCRVAVVADAIRAVDPAREAEVVRELVAHGATLTLTDVIVNAG